MRKFSIRTRLTLWYAGILAVTFALFAACLWLAVQHSIYRTVDADLRSRLEALKHYISEQEHEGEESDLQRELSEDADAVAATALIRITGDGGGWVYRSQGALSWPDLPALRTNLPPAGRISNVQIRGESFRILSAPARIGVMEIGVPLRQFHDVQRVFTWIVLAASPALLLLASLGGYWMSGRALRPVDDLVQQADRISAQNLKERLPVIGTGDELDRLSQTLNRMLARLESAFRRILAFTADASHELRTPVSIIRTTVEVTRLKPRIPEQLDSAWDAIVKQTDRMKLLLDDLLLLARADADSSVRMGEIIDAGDIVRETCAEMKMVAEAEGLALTLEAPKQCTMVGDADDLRRIVSVLLDNAVKYTPAPGRINVTLEQQGPADSSGSIAIAVRDTGVGISENDLPHIFDRFYRVSKDRSRQSGGAGLGLSIARHLIESRNGSIRVESTPGQGSAFYVVLPRSNTI